jgi:hypothetical protein
MAFVSKNKERKAALPRSWVLVWFEYYGKERGEEVDKGLKSACRIRRIVVIHQMSSSGSEILSPEKMPS